MKAPSPEDQLAGFLAKYTPEIAAEAVASLERLRPHVPGAVEMVYDNYNALVVGFGASERASEAVLSIAVMPRWVDLCFLVGADLPDPHGLLLGSGSVARHVVLKEAADIDTPAVRELIALAVGRSPRPFDTAAPGRMVVKSISARQRPRRPTSPSGGEKTSS
ncbi:MAG TPA: DUF1801 domain-containing protein [Longimicrobium sp.]|nr:DUF1801 domain-containing protein [Longimicrobium sp.]